MITYCTNIHPGESWEELFRNLAAYLGPIKEAVSPQQSFPVGLRLSRQAAMEIDDRECGSFLDWLNERDCYVPTVNGFPFGSFHTTSVKENVYLPDWRTKERADYTNRLADLLQRWLPPGMVGSISTVPVGFKYHVSRADYNLARQNLLVSLEHLDSLCQKSGKKIILSLEPEAACVLETVEDFIAFADEMRFPKYLTGYFGICFDCCHLAVEFASPHPSLDLLTQTGIPIGKVQISSALRTEGSKREALSEFIDPCYLHQVVIRREDDTFVRYNDLPQALSCHQTHGKEEWRIHFHLPIFIDKTDWFATTRSFITEGLPFFAPNTLLEVETYTWQVLPPALRTASVTDSIIRELQWLKGELNAQNRRS